MSKSSPILDNLVLYYDVDESDCTAERKPDIRELLKKDGLEQRADGTITFSAQKAARAPNGPLDKFIKDGKLCAKVDK